MRRNVLVAVIIFLLALLASSVAWADRSHHGHHGHRGHGFSQHHGFAHGHGHRHHGHAHGHRHRHNRADIIIGGTWHYRPYPRYYAQPQYYVYAYPPVVALQSPPVYIERSGQQELIQPTQPWWYYCDNPRGYYPYVRVCPNGWQRVPAQPPPEPR